MMDDQLYREQLLELYRNPQNHGTIRKADIVIHDYNPLCGDEIRITARVTAGTVRDIRFTGKGCAVSQASASLLTEEAKGKTLAGIEKMGREDMSALLGLMPSVSRVKCMMLALTALKKGIVKYRSVNHAA